MNMKWGEESSKRVQWYWGSPKSGGRGADATVGQRCFEDGRAQTKEQTRNSLDVDKSRDMDPLQSLQQERSSVNISTVARWNAFWTAHCQHWRVRNLLEFITGNEACASQGHTRGLFSL